MRLRKASLLPILIVLAVIVFAAATIVTLRPKIEALQQEKEALAADTALLEQEKQKAQEAIAALGTDSAVTAIARQRLHLVADGEILYIDSSK